MQQVHAIFGAEGVRSAEGEPAYRLVVSASAQKGAGVTFYGQRLSDTYRASVSCRIPSFSLQSRTSRAGSFAPAGIRSR